MWMGAAGLVAAAAGAFVKRRSNMQAQREHE
jgi:hypothetical protein